MIIFGNVRVIIPYKCLAQPNLAESELGTAQPKLASSFWSIVENQFELVFYNLNMVYKVHTTI